MRDSTENSRIASSLSIPTRQRNLHRRRTDLVNETCGTAEPLLAEISGGEFRLLLERLAPEFASLIRLALRFQRMAQIEQRFREVGTIRQSFLIKADSIFYLAGLLQQQT